jgi:glutamine synthetase
MKDESLIMVCTCGMSGRVRGKAFPASDLALRLQRGVSWVPSYSMISAFSTMEDQTFGTAGDLILVPDAGAEVNVSFGETGGREHFYLGDIRHVDGKRWECCPRGFLRRGLLELEVAGRVTLISSFEHEFVYTGIDDLPGNPFSLDAYRRQGQFGEVFFAALRSAGVEPDTFGPGFGPRQFEFTIGAAGGIRAADRAVIAREMARATAFYLGHRVSFSPLLEPDGVANGLRIHLSFRSPEGWAMTHDPQGPLGMSELARAFMAGVLHHLRAVCAMTMPSVVSYVRPGPQRPTPTHGTLKVQDRNAALRVCPVLRLPGFEAERQYNIEFRVADSAASPYLALGAIVWAGVDGIKRNLPLPTTPEPLPTSLGEALDALEATPEAREWCGNTLLEAYVAHKRAEIARLAPLDVAIQCASYGLTY